MKFERRDDGMYELSYPDVEGVSIVTGNLSTAIKALRIRAPELARPIIIIETGE